MGACEEDELGDPQYIANSMVRPPLSTAFLALPCCLHQAVLRHSMRIYGSRKARLVMRIHNITTSLLVPQCTLPLDQYNFLKPRHHFIFIAGWRAWVRAWKSPTSVCILRKIAGTPSVTDWDVKWQGSLLRWTHIQIHINSAAVCCPVECLDSLPGKSCILCFGFGLF